MKIAKVFTAIPRAFFIILDSKEILRLALWPWLIGLVSYVATALGAIYLYTPILYEIMHTPQSWWQSVLYFVVQIALALFLFISSVIISITFVLILTSVFQTAISEKILDKLGAEVPEQESGVKALAKESLRTILVESFKLIWLVPIMVLLFIIGFIPLLTPFAIVAASWLLAFQFIDVVLDIYRISAFKRFSFCIKHFPIVVSFGFSLTALWAIPLVGILIPPVAVAAASLVLFEQGLLETVSKRAAIKSP